MIGALCRLCQLERRGELRGFSSTSWPAPVSTSEKVFSTNSNPSTPAKAAIAACWASSPMPGRPFLLALERRT